MRFLLIFLSAAPLALSFRQGRLDPLHESYRLAKRLSERAGIDESHNHIHSKEVLFWAHMLMRNSTMDWNERLMVGQCAILHDMMDSKYTDFSAVVRRHLGRTHPPREVRRMMSVMGTMSYSKVVAPDGTIAMPPAEDRIFHTVREADLLSSFNIARMIEYRISGKIGEMTDSDIRKEVADLYMERMARLQERGLFTTRRGRLLAAALDTIGRLRLFLLDRINLHGNLDILRVVNHISIHDLIHHMEQPGV